VQGCPGYNHDFPRSVTEARKSPYWTMVRDALEAEIKGKFVDNRAWDVVPRPTTDRKEVKSKANGCYATS